CVHQHYSLKLRELNPFNSRPAMRAGRIEGARTVNIELIADEEETRTGLPSSASLRSAITMKSDNNFIASHRSVKHLRYGLRPAFKAQSKNHKRFPLFDKPAPPPLQSRPSQHLCSATRTSSAAPPAGPWPRCV